MPFASTTLGAEQPLLNSELLGYGRDPLAPIKDAVTADGDVVVPLDARRSARPTDHELMTRGLEDTEFVTANAFVRRSALGRVGGFDEALLLDKEGFVAEGSGENIFFLKGGTLYPVAHSVNLRGITRDSVVKLAEHLGTPVVPTMATRDELYIADEVFMTGTAAEVSPVSFIDRRPIGTGRAGETTMRLRELYLKAAAGEVPEFEHWLTYAR